MARLLSFLASWLALQLIPNKELGVLCCFSILFSNDILSLFEVTLQKFNDSFLILIYGVCGILIFRGLYGNLLSSIGKAHVNLYITSVALLTNVVSNYYLIPKFIIK